MGMTPGIKSFVAAVLGGIESFLVLRLVALLLVFWKLLRQRLDYLISVMPLSMRF